ncbi:MAG: transposase, partial [Solobacterium sp.]|nr:transposase [Solobacterium sp.]
VESYKKYYRLKFDENGYLLNYKRKSEVIDELIASTGMFVIITSVEMSAEEAIDKYRNRDSIEKLFRTEKSYMGFDCFRVHDEERMKAKLFVLFISLIIRTEIYNRLKPLYLKDAKNYTVPKALKELEKLYLTKLADDKYHQRYLLTAKQKKILKAFEIEENDYKKTANEIADRLT